MAQQSYALRVAQLRLYGTKGDCESKAATGVVIERASF